MSPLPNPPRTAQGEGDNSQQRQNDTEETLRAVSQSGIVDGRLAADEDLLSASTVNVEHKLGRAYRGWAVVDKSAESTVWRDTTSTDDTKLFLSLKCSADVTVDLWVF